MKTKELKQALYDMALEIAKLKETECGNSGHNWLNRFIRDYELLDETEFTN